MDNFWFGEDINYELAFHEAVAEECIPTATEWTLIEIFKTDDDVTALIENVRRKSKV